MTDEPDPDREEDLAGYLWEVRRGLLVRFHIVPDRDTALAAARAGEGDSG